MEADTVQIRDIVAKPGTRASGFLTLGETPSEPIRIPLVIVQGRRPGPRLCLTAGVHAAEYPGIDAVMQTVQGLDPEELAGIRRRGPGCQSANVPAALGLSLAHRWSQSQSHCSWPGRWHHLGSTRLRPLERRHRRLPVPHRLSWWRPGRDPLALRWLRADWQSRAGRPGRGAGSPLQPVHRRALSRGFRASPDDRLVDVSGGAPRCRLDPRRSWRQWHARPCRR